MNIYIRFLSIFFSVLLLLSISFSSKAQSTQNLDSLSKVLVNLSDSVPGLKNKIDFSLQGVPLSSVVSAIAFENKLNVWVSPDIDIKIHNTFSNLNIIEFFIFLCQQYPLSIDVTGNIISFAPLKIPEPIEKPNFNLNISYDSIADKLSLDADNVPIGLFSKEFIKQTGQNLSFSKQVSACNIDAFCEEAPLDEALENIAFSNGLILNNQSENFYSFSKQIQQKHKGKSSENKGSLLKQGAGFDLKIIQDSLVTLFSDNQPLDLAIKTILQEAGQNFVQLDKIEGTLNMTTNQMPLLSLLSSLSSSLEFSFYQKDGVIYLGTNNNKYFNTSRLYKFQHRSVIDVSNLIPSSLKEEVEIIEFADLNAVICTGAENNIAELELFFHQIDQSVPVILIEVLIIDHKKSNSISTGIQAGLDNTGEIVTQGRVLPGIDMTLSAGTINELINGFNSFGLFNLGNVTPNFYVSLSALEDQGVIKVNSTPKLSTLNGIESTLKIGNTEYYIEERNDIVGTQNPQNITTRQYKPVSANFTVTIMPIVSGDDNITLEITVDQSDFTARISKDAPPGQEVRNFSSTIRVKNNEMVLLGGLEKKESSNTGSGTPFLSRVPVIKWFFSSRQKTKNKSKLSIFIRPIIIY